MRKLILAATTIAALAVPVIAPALASASVDRYQTQTATFQTTQLRGEGGLWYHDYTVTVNPCTNTFSGTGDVYGLDNGVKAQEFAETINGTFNGDNTVSFTADRAPFNVINSYSMTNAPMDSTTDSPGGTYPNPGWNITLKVTPEVITSTSNYKNHGDYVSQAGGGADAAHSCIGMPIH